MTSVAPSQENDRVDGVRCTRCGATNQAGEDRCSHCQSWLTGNGAAVKSGLYRREQPLDLRMSAAELVDGIVSDLGGLPELSTLERQYVQHIGDLSIALRILVGDLAADFFTPGRNPRAAYDKYLAGLDRFDRLSQRLGLPRRSKLASSPRAAIEAIVAARSNGHAQPGGTE